MFCARRRARATPAAAIPRLPAAAAAAPPWAGGGRLAPPRPLGGGPGAWARRPARRAAGVWWRGVGGAARSPQRTKWKEPQWRVTSSARSLRHGGRSRRHRRCGGAHRASGQAAPARPHGGEERGRPGVGAPRRGGTATAAGTALCPRAASGGRNRGSRPGQAAAALLGSWACACCPLAASLHVCTK